uniref:Uncharacterized protein n=1 Tax=Musa acuminata subsp. malaccensis TaxID=214687 RepID=A0A804JFY3_MUSAM
MYLKLLLPELSIIWIFLLFPYSLRKKAGFWAPIVDAILRISGHLVDELDLCVAVRRSVGRNFLCLF